MQLTEPERPYTRVWEVLAGLAALTLVILLVGAITSTIADGNHKAAYVKNCASTTLDDLTQAQTEEYCACAYDDIKERAGGREQFDEYINNMTLRTSVKVANKCLP